MVIKLRKNKEVDLASVSFFSGERYFVCGKLLELSLCPNEMVPNRKELSKLMVINNKPY